MNCPLDIIEDPWPENDDHLREYRWRDSKGNEWFYDIDLMSWLINCNGNALYTKSDIPTGGPWNKVKDYEMSNDYIRIIDPSEIKVGMVIEWDNGDDFTVKCTVESVEYVEAKDYFSAGSAYYINGDETALGRVTAGAEVRVISEPEIIQPEEPTSFGACVVVNGIHFIRYIVGSSEYQWCSEDKSATNWDELCSMGQVEIVNEDPFRGV